MPQTLRVQRLSGSQIVDHLPDLARLRIKVFRDFPYLYQGDPGYEEKYLQTYVKAPDSVIVIVFDGDTVVGASTGIPLADEAPELKQPFIEQGYDVNHIFYCAESVLLPEYRGRGLGVQFFKEREAHARELGRFNIICFASVQRPADHPRRPPDYVPLDRFWTKRGYEKHPELRTTFSWRDLDETEESPKPLVFWLKRLQVG